VLAVSVSAKSLILRSRIDASECPIRACSIRTVVSVTPRCLAGAYNRGGVERRTCHSFRSSDTSGLGAEGVAAVRARGYGVPSASRADCRASRSADRHGSHRLQRNDCQPLAVLVVLISTPQPVQLVRQVTSQTLRKRDRSCGTACTASNTVPSCSSRKPGGGRTAGCHGGAGVRRRLRITTSY
jgi:hypothetical protein